MNILGIYTANFPQGPLRPGGISRGSAISAVQIAGTMTVTNRTLTLLQVP